MAYFIRRSGDDCAVIALDPDDREETIASGLAIGDAEDLCASKIEALRTAGGPASLAPAPAPRLRLGKHGGRQMAFRFD
jgi:hypothetical protein